MSTLKVDTIQDASGSNASTTAQIEQGRAKAWVNFNGNSFGIRDSFNVGSVTDHGPGQYNINFASNMTNDDYCLTVSHSLNPHNNITHGTLYIYDESSQTTSGVRVHNCNNQGSSQTVDKNIVCVSIFGDQ